MPIYEYQCPKCHLSFEKMLPMQARDSAVNCLQCGFERVEKMVSCFCSPGGEKATAGGSSACSSCSSGNCGSCR